MYKSINYDYQPRNIIFPVIYLSFQDVSKANIGPNNNKSIMLVSLDYPSHRIHYQIDVLHSTNNKLKNYM